MDKHGERILQIERGKARDCAAARGSAKWQGSVAEEAWSSTNNHEMDKLEL